jgi:hypothetical protein
MLISRKRTTAALILIAGLALLPGCSGADTPPAASAPEPATATTTAADDCGDAATTVRDHLKSSDVRTVTVNGQCTNVTIETELDDDNNADGKLLCESAAEVAYIGDINSVTVVSKSGAELSVGIPGMKCLP